LPIWFLITGCFSSQPPRVNPPQVSFSPLSHPARTLHRSLFGVK
jgi:hypothetical protein